MTDSPSNPHCQSRFPVIGNCLHVGGMPLPRLALRAGGTPFYAYDREVLSARAKELRDVLPRQMRIHYSVKANPMPALVQHMAGLVDGCDVSSAGELKIALDTAMRPENISFSGPGKTEPELVQAIAAGVVLNVESAREIDNAARIGDRLGMTPRVAVRINPDFELKSSGMKMGGGAKQFGIDAEQVPEVLKTMGALGLAFQGFHIFSGSQNLKSEAIIEAQSRTFELALRLASSAPQPVRLLNIGGGFGVPYFQGDVPLDIEAIGAHLHDWMPRIINALPETAVALELGRYLVSEAGLYVTRVIDRKVSRGHVFLVTDGGMHHHLAASGNLGQVIRRNYPVLIGNKAASAKDEVVSIVGPLCTPLDMLADKIALPHADVGDFVVVLQSGAYGLTASPTAFLSHSLPAEILV